jgi:hypothetical protein
MRQMRAGSSFDAAFVNAIGIPLGEFERQTLRAHFADAAFSHAVHGRGAGGP